MGAKRAQRRDRDSGSVHMGVVFKRLRLDKETTQEHTLKSDDNG